jgi:hypothetical protein
MILRTHVLANRNRSCKLRLVRCEGPSTPIQSKQREPEAESLGLFVSLRAWLTGRTPLRPTLLWILERKGSGLVLFHQVL